MALALANHNLPSEWHREDPEDIATAVHVLSEIRERSTNG